VRIGRNLLLQERSRSCGGEAALTWCALGTQEAIGCRSAHGKQLASTFLRDLEMLMPLQGVDEREQKRYEAFGANAIGRVPDQEQRVLDFWPIPARAWTLKRLLHLFCMVEKPPGVFAHIAGGCDKGIKKCLFL